MAFQSGKGASVLHNTIDLSTFFKKAAIETTMGALETTTFTATGRTFIASLLGGGKLQLDGYWDGSANAADVILQAALGAADPVITYGPMGTTLGNLAKLMAGLEERYSIEEAVDQVCAISAQIQPDGGIDGGVYLHPLQLESANVNTASVDNLAGTTNGGVGHLHVTAVNALTTATVKVQHSTDNATWADLITFTAVTGVTQQRVIVAAGTTVNRYTRTTLTGLTGTSLTYATAFARR